MPLSLPMRLPGDTIRGQRGRDQGTRGDAIRGRDQGTEGTRSGDAIRGRDQGTRGDAIRGRDQGTEGTRHEASVQTRDGAARPAAAGAVARQPPAVGAENCRSEKRAPTPPAAKRQQRPAAESCGARRGAARHREPVLQAGPALAALLRGAATRRLRRGGGEGREERAAGRHRRQLVKLHLNVIQGPGQAPVQRVFQHLVLCRRRRRRRRWVFRSADPSREAEGPATRAEDPGPGSGDEGPGGSPSTRDRPGRRKWPRRRIPAFLPFGIKASCVWPHRAPRSPCRPYYGCAEWRPALLRAGPALVRAWPAVACLRPRC